MFNERLEQLSEHFDLEQLELQESEQIKHLIAEGKRKLTQSITDAKKKKGFSNTLVGKHIKENTLFDLIQETTIKIGLLAKRGSGYRAAEYLKVINHFMNTWQQLLQLQQPEIEADQLNEDTHNLLFSQVEEWVFIGLNTMLDAAGTPASNDLQMKQTRDQRIRMHDKHNLPKRPSTTKVQHDIGEMIMFQTRMAIYAAVFPKWSELRRKDASKSGNAGLRYFIRDLNQDMDGLLAYLKLQQVSTTDPVEAEKLEKICKLFVSLVDLPFNSDEFNIYLGSFIYHNVYETLDIFQEIQPQLKKPKLLQLKERADLVNKAWVAAKHRSFINRPMLAPPQELTAEMRGGRAVHADAAPLRSNKGDIQMSQQRLDFFNNQALVPFKLNSWVFDVMTLFKNKGIELGGFDFYVAPELPLPSQLVLEKERPADFDRWDEKQQLAWVKQHPYWKEANRKVSKDRTAQIKRLGESRDSREIYSLASDYHFAQAFWIPTRPEFRGRLLADSPLLNYQGRDCAKALIKLAVPVSIEGKEDTARFWLANHLAGAYGKALDKKRFSKRIDTIESPKVQAQIQAVAEMLTHDFAAGLDVLKEVDGADGDAWLFMAACREWYELFIARTKTTTDLLVGCDCSCSGQQFAAAWRKHKGIAKATNVLPADEPSDLYADVWTEIAKLAGEGAFSTRHERKLRNEGIGRKIAKGGIQPGQYGAGKDTSLDGVRAKMDSIKLKLSEDERQVILSNFEEALNTVCEMNTTNTWFRYVAKRIYEQQTADGVADPKIVIPTALGDEIHIRYLKEETYRIQTYKFGSITYKYRAQTDRLEPDSLADSRQVQLSLVRPTGEPSEADWRTSLLANTTHGAGDATLLAMALHDADFHFATCHDAMYCSAVDMPEMRDRVRRAFVEVAKFPMFDALLAANGIEIPKGYKTNPVQEEGSADFWNDYEQVLESNYLLS